MKAIIVEDEIRIREGLCRLMGKMFPEIEVAAVAEDGLEGLAYIEYHKPDLVITDIKMPGMDGLEMLTKAQTLNLFPKVIVLTAYSEFSYAQQAVRLGVQDYLVKPIVVQEFMQTVRKVQNLWELEQKRTPDAMGSLEHIVSGLLHGTSTLDMDTEVFLEKRHGLEPGRPLVELLVYLGSSFQDRSASVRRDMEQLLKQRQGIKSCIVTVEYDQVVLALVYHYNSRESFEQWYANRVRQYIPAEGTPLGYGITEIPGLGGLREGYQKLLSSLEWNISLGSSALISVAKIAELQRDICVYPVELENQLKIALCAGDSSRVRRVAKEFRKYFLSGKVYAPNEIKESCVRFLWSFLNVAKEVGCMDGQELDQRRLLDQVMGAKTIAELSQPFEDLLDRLRVSDGEGGGVSLAVKRAQSMVHEFYGDGITLNEIAGRLNMSQEYLGTQFHKETGEPFSLYIRNYRMAKAKELLIGTQLKQYEIAQRVGYTDAKYFARVFRECTGMSPAEYRKSYR